MTNEIADVLSLADPIARDPTQSSRKAIDVERPGASLHVDIAGEASDMLRVPEEEDALDGVKGGASELA